MIFFGAVWKEEFDFFFCRVRVMISLIKILNLLNFGFVGRFFNNEVNFFNCDNVFCAFWKAEFEFSIFVRIEL